MAITFSCPGCGKSYTAGDEFAGKKMRCKACQGEVPIPSGDEPDLYGLDEPDLYGLDDPPPLPPPRLGFGPRPSMAEPPRMVSAGRGSSGKSFFSGSIWVNVFAGVCILSLTTRIVTGLIRLNRGPDAPGAAAAGPMNPAGPMNGRVGGYQPRPRMPVAPPVMPPLGGGRPVEPGVVLHEVRLGMSSTTPPVPGQRGKLWVYLPADATAPASVPCVFICGSMIEVGLPKGVEWLAGLAGLPLKPTQPPPATAPRPAGLGPRANGPVGFGPPPGIRRGPAPRPPIRSRARMPGRPVAP